MITLKIKYTTNSLSFQHNPKKNVKNSVLGVSHVPLDQEDIFSLQTFKEIQEERFANHMDFYVCVVKENDHFFFFEGSRFIEAFLKEGKKLNNPMTRNDIQNFEILCCYKDNPVFSSFKMKKQIETLPHYLPILWNDHTRAIEERADYLNRMGNCYYLGDGVEKNIDLAIDFCEKAAKLGYSRAKINLSSFFQNIRENKKSLYWLVSFLNSKDSQITSHNLLCAAIKFQLENYISVSISYSTYYYKQAALLGNFYGIGNLIFCYEEGEGIIANRKKASLWRTYLPEEWQSRDIIEFLNHIKKSESDYYKQTQQLSIPRELLENEPGLQPPDADTLFPEIKKELERRITPENLYHFFGKAEGCKESYKNQDFNKMGNDSDGYKADSELNPWTKV